MPSTNHIIIAVVLIALLVGGYMWLHSAHTAAQTKNAATGGASSTATNFVAGGMAMKPTSTLMA